MRQKEGGDGGKREKGQEEKMNKKLCPDTREWTQERSSSAAWVTKGKRRALSTKAKMLQNGERGL
jgi:hypothetical protein